MQGVLLAGGTGGRLRPLTSDTAKVMVEIDGRPMISYSMDQMINAGVSEFIVVTGYRSNDIIDYFGTKYRETPIQYVHQEEQLGTAHALLRAQKHLEEEFVLMHPDNIYGNSFDLTRITQYHQQSEADATVLLNQVKKEEAKQSGVVVLDDSESVKEVVEKPESPPSNWILCGTYVFSAKIIHSCHIITPSDRGEYELTDAIDLLLAAGRSVATRDLDTWVVNVNTPEDLELAEGLLIRN